MSETVVISTPCTSSESCGVLLVSAGHDLTGHQTSATMSFSQFVHSPLLTMLYYTVFNRPGVTGAVIQTPPSLIKSAILFLQIFKTP